MDEKIIPDLEDPVPKPRLKPQEIAHHRWHIALSIFAASMIYTVLHKTVIPMTLTVLGTSKKEYATISFQTMWVVALGYCLHRDHRIGKRVHFLIGAVLALCLKEVLLAVFQTPKGWLFFSHLLASVPLAVASLFLLPFAKKISTAQLILGFLAFYVVEYFL